MSAPRLFCGRCERKVIDGACRCPGGVPALDAAEARAAAEHAETMESLRALNATLEATQAAYRFASRNPSDDEIMRVAEEIATARAYRTGDTFADPAASQRYFEALLAHRQSETFAVALLDTKHRLIACVEMFHGTIDGCAVPVREVVRAALTHNATAVILSHNHPSGVTEPSAADRAITQRLREALELVDVRVLDHIVVGGNGTPTSLAQRGWL